MCECVRCVRVCVYIRCVYAVGGAAALLKERSARACERVCVRCMRVCVRCMRVRVRACARVRVYTRKQGGLQRS